MSFESQQDQHSSISPLSDSFLYNSASRTSAWAQGMEDVGSERAAWDDVKVRGERSPSNTRTMMMQGTMKKRFFVTHGSFRTARSKCASNDEGRGSHALPAAGAFQLAHTRRQFKLYQWQDRLATAAVVVRKKDTYDLGTTNEKSAGYRLSGERERRTKETHCG